MIRGLRIWEGDELLISTPDPALWFRRDLTLIRCHEGEKTFASWVKGILEVYETLAPDTVADRRGTPFWEEIPLSGARRYFKEFGRDLEEMLDTLAEMTPEDY